MRISARCEYACKALLELSLHWPKKEPLPIHTISKNQDIPMKYLVQILIQLKRRGLVKSSRGKEGGYNLAVTPDKIRLGWVIREIGGPLLPVANSGKQDESVFAKIWDEVENAMAEVVDKLTFDNICDRERGISRVPLYHI
jgi:Rrf2 family protein